MSAVSWRLGWAAISRALSHSAPRNARAALALRSSSRVTSNAVNVDFVGNTTKPAPAIFENTSDEYAAVAHTAPPPAPPSVASLIEAKLPLHLSPPLPSDSSVFEESSLDDYQTFTVSPGENHSSVFQVIEDLINSGRQEEARKICVEMQSANIDIPASIVFARAAKDAIDGRGHQGATPSESEQEARGQSFLFWASLLPTIDEHIDTDRRTRTFYFLRLRVYRNLHDTLLVPTVFSILMAEKGYAEIFCREAIPYMCRYASPAASVRFVREYLDADLRYTAKKDPRLQDLGESVHFDEVILERKKELAEYVQGPAIYTLAILGEIDAAMSLLPSPSNPYQLPARHYSSLHHILSTADTNQSANIALVRELQNDPRYSVSPPPEPVAEVKSGRTLENSRTLPHLQALKPELDPNSPRYIGDNLATQLHQILEKLATSTLREDEPVVNNFLSGYYGAGHHTAIYDLRCLALQRNRVMGGRFLYCEMAYYLKNDLSLLVLETFERHFLISGVPKDILLAMLRASDSVQHKDHSHPAYQTLRRSKRKLWTTRAHSDLVWHAMAKSIPTGPDFEDFYKIFVDFQSREYTVDEAHLAAPRRSEFRVGGGVFNVLLKRLFHSMTEPVKGASAVRDMIKIGVKPTIENFTLLAAFYAHCEDMERLFHLIDALEHKYPVEARRPMDTRRPVARTYPDMPPPDTIFYSAIIAKLTRRSRLRETQEVWKLFQNRFEYVYGVHPPLDDALGRLTSLEREFERQQLKGPSNPFNPEA